MKASSRLACSTRRSLATIWWRARTEVTAWTQVARAGHDDDRARSLDALTSGRSVSSGPRSGPTAGTGAAAPGRPSRRCPAGVSSAITRPGAEDGHPVGEPLGLLHQVRDEEDGHAAIADRLDQVPRLAAGLRVEPGRQLVEDRDLRPADERQGDRQALLLAARQVPVGRVALVVEPEVVDQLARIGRVSVERGEQVERLADGDPVGQLALLELDADEGPQSVAVPPGIEPEHADRAGVGRPQTGDRLDGRGLAGAVRSEDAEDLALLDGERDAVDGRRDRRSACVRSVTSMTFMGQGSQRATAGTSNVRPERTGASADGRINRSVDGEAGRTQCACNPATRPSGPLTPSPDRRWSLAGHGRPIDRAREIDARTEVQP